MPKTLLDSFSSLAAASGDEHSSMTELKSSVLFLLHASMISSDGFAPYKLVSFKVQSGNNLVDVKIVCERQQKFKS